MRWEEHRQKEFQQLIISTMASQATAHERERQDLEELRRSEVAEDQADREHEEHDLDKKRQNTPHLPRMQEDVDIEAYLVAFER